LELTVEVKEEDDRDVRIGKERGDNGDGKRELGELLGNEQHPDDSAVKQYGLPRGEYGLLGKLDQKGFKCNEPHVLLLDAAT
jgi:hypothetical protein